MRAAASPRARRTPTLRHGSLFSRRAPGRKFMCRREPARIARRLRKTPLPHMRASRSERDRRGGSVLDRVFLQSTPPRHRAWWLVFAHENVAIASCSQASSVCGSVGRPSRLLATWERRVLLRQCQWLGSDRRLYVQKAVVGSVAGAVFPVAGRVGAGSVIIVDRFGNSSWVAGLCR